MTKWQIRVSKSHRQDKEAEAEGKHHDEVAKQEEGNNGLLQQLENAQH